MRAVALAFAFHFVVLASYYVLRPIRDEIGAAGGVENLSWMFTATLAGMLLANALFSAIVQRMSRRRFIPLAYRFFMATLLAFYTLMQVGGATQELWVGRAARGGGVVRARLRPSCRRRGPCVRAASSVVRDAGPRLPPG